MPPRDPAPHAHQHTCIAAPHPAAGPLLTCDLTACVRFRRNANVPMPMCQCNVQMPTCKCLSVPMTDTPMRETPMRETPVPMPAC